MGEAIEGTLFVARSQPQEEGGYREEAIEFRTLQELLDACVAQAKGGAFVRVQVVGISAGRPHRLVLDFGHFGVFAD
ncbi:MAG: hypothetical protein E6J78_02900 [Deltaproteobacteria bacterium]|nr:MAG: hypothetical protein E6J78_02900 [Deltaproteobacteria bacterium]